MRYRADVPQPSLVRQRVSDTGGDDFADRLRAENIRLLRAGGLSPSKKFRLLTTAATRTLLAQNVVGVDDSTFLVHFETTKWRPAHEVTLRCAEAGWAREIYGFYWIGGYWDGAYLPKGLHKPGWYFKLPNSVFPDGVTMKLVLDETYWMMGFDRHLDGGTDHHFTEADVDFERAEERFLLPFGDFRALGSSRRQQDTAFGNVNTDVEYDVIVVGSGMGGGILADQLTDRGAKTLVLEIGTLGLSTHMHNLPGDWDALAHRSEVVNFENKDDSKLLFGVQMMLGGRSVFWSGLIPRMRDWEMTAWPSEMAQYLKSTGYDRAEIVMRKERTLGEFQNQVVGRLAADLSDYIVTDQPRSKDQPGLTAADNERFVLGNVVDAPTGTFSTAELLLDSLGYPGTAGRDNLTVNLQHRVVTVESTGARSAVVHCQDLAGNIARSYRSKFVVLSAGSMESPRIALQSSLDDPNQKIGRGFTDHPAYFSTSPSSPYGLPIPKTLPDGNPHPYGDPRVSAKLMIQRQPESAEDYPFNTEVLINGWFWDFRHADEEVRAAQLERELTARIKFQHNFSSPLDESNWLMLQGNDQRIGVHVTPNEAGRAYGDKCWELENQVLQALGIPREADSGMYYGNEGTPHHAGGSLRMSGDRSGVVDTDLKFESYPNLYACDVSIFPAIPCANPSLTLAALSLRLADHLAELLQS